MAVQARFYVAEITKQAYGGWAPPAPAGKVILQPVTRGEANKDWASATPSGRIEMTIITGALAWFEERLGQEVAITFEDRPADELSK